MGAAHHLGEPDVAFPLGLHTGDQVDEGADSGSPLHKRLSQLMDSNRQKASRLMRSLLREEKRNGREAESLEHFTGGEI